MGARILFLSLMLLSLRAEAKICGEVPEGGSFYYFAYGSNMLPERMRVNCKTAESCSAAKLDNYRLDFNMSLPRWNGAVATIVPDNGTTVWGNLWQISVFESSKLDQQEGVALNWYYPTDVNVTLTNGLTVPARVYINRYPPATNVTPENLPPERQPSRTYQQVMLLGAMQSHLPVIYLNYLLRFPNNGKLAPSLTREDLGYPFYDSSFT